MRISANNQQQQSDKNKRRYFMSQISNSYNYSFRLPDKVAADVEPTTELNNGILKISFTKTKKEAPKRLRIGKKKDGENSNKQKINEAKNGK
ncbi:MAG: Hsp20 family protein [Patescibacteria group bacterium]